MDVVFWYSSELNWKGNLERLKEVVGQQANIYEHCGIGLSKKENLDQIAVMAILHYGIDTPFILVEGDNWVFDNFTELLSRSTTTKLFAQSPYGFAYEHGGIKITTANQILQAIKRASTEHDISVYFSLPTDSGVFSRHSFDTTLLNEFVVAAKEIIKLYWWGNESLLANWRSDHKARRIYEAVIKNISKFNISVVSNPDTLIEVLKDVFYQDFMRVAVLGIMKNEELHITRYLNDFGHFDKIFLLDTGSTDGTITKTHGRAQVFCSEFSQVNYSDFRNTLLSNVEDQLNEYDFVIWADIDESPNYAECSAHQLKVFLSKQPKEKRVFEFSRSDIGGAPPLNMIRIFRADVRGEWIFQIHEQFQVHGDTHIPVLTPLKVTHLESERIQLLDKFIRYKELITRNFLDAVAKNDEGSAFHYLFFYVDIISQVCDSDEMIRIFHDHVKGGNKFEFAAWYLRKFLSYFACMQRHDLITEAERVITEQYPQHLEYVNFTKSLVEDVIKNGAPFTAVVSRDRFKKFDDVDYPVKLVISLQGEISMPVITDLQVFYDNLTTFYKVNSIYTSSELVEACQEVRIIFDFDSNVEYYQLHGSYECSLVFIELMLIAIKHRLRKFVGVVRD